MLKLKSTGEQVFSVPYIGTGVKPWRDGYTRIVIIGKCGHSNRMQIVADGNLSKD